VDKTTSTHALPYTIIAPKPIKIIEVVVFFFCGVLLGYEVCKEVWGDHSVGV
jgi:hypothetical protein